MVFDFGRHGYEEITVVLDSAGFDEELAKTIALNTAAGHEFAKGFRYRDFSPGDKIAAVGAAAVVAGSLGVRWNRGVVASILAGIALIAKKAWFLLIVPFLWLGRVVSRWFSGGS